MGLSEITLDNLDQAFDYAPWNDEQKFAGGQYKEHLKAAARVLLTHVPRSPLRTRALNMLADVRMLGNAAITHEGAADNRNKE